MIVVIRPGPLTTVQDLGRAGAAHLGVPRSGAADRPALRRANARVGNPENAAALEFTMAGAELRFGLDARITLAGADMPMSLDGRALPRGAAHEVRAGQTLLVGPSRAGLRGYLAIAGGINIQPVLGSRSHDSLSGLGPAPLAVGDRLSIGRRRGWPHAVLPEPLFEAEPTLRLAPGPRDDRFTAQALVLLCEQVYRVLPDSNRVGVRLQAGAPLQLRADLPRLPSEGIAHGAVQVPGNGQPILFLADHPVTGGYPCIAVLTPASLARAAQLVPGQTLRFTRSNA